MYLKHFHYDIFDVYEETNTGIDTSGRALIKVNFIANEAGDISYAKLKMEPTIDPIEFKRTPNIIDVTNETLEKYIGKYELNETPIKVYIREDKLFVFVPGQPEYELLPTDKHKFSFKALEGFKVEFLESLDGSINEVNFIQPNGTFKVTRKKE